MFLRRTVVVALAKLVLFVSANVEKVVFLGPQPLADGLDANLDELKVNALTPQNSAVRLYVPVAFATAADSKGRDSWYLLDGLVPGQRYEVRVCWAAIQPTKFRLYTHAFSDVFEDDKLLSGLTEYSQEINDFDVTQEASLEQARENTGRLLLQVSAAADFFSPIESLMNSPPPVLVDIILDPFVFNLVPKSLVPVVGYIVIVAVAGWYLADFIWAWIRDINHTGVKTNVDMSNQTDKAVTQQPPLYRLPLDLILMITDLLEPEHFINFAMANYSLLRRHGLVPPMSEARLSALVRRTRLPSMLRLVPLPPELLLQTMRHLDRVDMMQFAIANYCDLVLNGIAPPLTRNRILPLRAACGKG